MHSSHSQSIIHFRLVQNLIPTDIETVLQVHPLPTVLRHGKIQPMTHLVFCTPCSVALSVEGVTRMEGVMDLRLDTAVRIQIRLLALQVEEMTRGTTFLVVGARTLIKIMCTLMTFLTVIYSIDFLIFLVLSDTHEIVTRMKISLSWSV